jgi:hypothetical protein
MRVMNDTEGRRATTDGRRWLLVDGRRRGERGAGEPGWTWATHVVIAELDLRRAGAEGGEDRKAKGRATLLLGTEIVCIAGLSSRVCGK